jgi:hypothetical protein
MNNSEELPKEKNISLGENSPNLVTLLEDMTHAKDFCSKPTAEACQNVSLF